MALRDLGRTVEIDIETDAEVGARFVLADERGRLFVRGPESLSPSPGQRELAWLAGMGKMPWAALAGAVPGSRRGTLRFQRPPGTGKPITLSLERSRFVSREVPFEFRDVPLP